jgi:hypothetical protein
MGFVTPDVGSDHPDFGRAFPCPTCGGPVDLQARQWRALEKYFGDYWMFGSAKLDEYGLDAFLDMPPALANGKQAMTMALWLWAHGEALTYEAVHLPDPTYGFEPSSALVLSGSPGLGKTCGAAAAFEHRRDGQPGLAIEYNALMQAIQGTYGDDNANTSAVVQAVATTRLLFLDDFGNVDRRQSETDDKTTKIFEVLNHRYNHKLPTIITTNLSADHMIEQFGYKLARRLRSWPLWVDVRGVGLDLPTPRNGDAPGGA